jgi:hypothetical protein
MRQNLSLKPSLDSKGEAMMKTKNHPSLGKVTAMIKKRPNIHIISNSHPDNAINLLLLIIMPMQDSKTVM